MFYCLLVYGGRSFYNARRRYETLADSITELEFGILELEREQSKKLAEVRENYIQEPRQAGLVYFISRSARACPA